MSGVDREDGGARKRREAEGEGGDLAGRWQARGREPAWSACASLGKGGGKERGRSAGGGAGGAGEGRGGERRQAVSSGKERRLAAVDPAALALAAEKKPRRRSAHLQVSRSRAALKACGRGCFTTSVGGAKAEQGKGRSARPSHATSVTSESSAVV